MKLGFRIQRLYLQINIDSSNKDLNFAYFYSSTVWPEKNCQMSIKLPKNDFTRKMIATGLIGKDFFDSLFFNMESLFYRDAPTVNELTNINRSVESPFVVQVKVKCMNLNRYRYKALNPHPCTIRSTTESTYLSPTNTLGLKFYK